MTRAAVITVHVPMDRLPRLSLIAGLRGYTSVTEFVEALIDRTVNTTRDSDEEVLMLVRMGFSDAVIAGKINRLKNYVADVRRRGGLPPNRNGAPIPRKAGTP